MGIKPSDDLCLPLCVSHHSEVHDKWGDEFEFWPHYGVDEPLKLARALWEARHDAMRFFQLWQTRKL